MTDRYHTNNTPHPMWCASQTRLTAGHMLQKTGYTTLRVGQLKRITLPASRSAIVQQNGGILYGCLFYGLEGLFRKDQPDSLADGRHLCDLVRTTFACHGFFTSDELPRYGIRHAERRHIFAHMQKQEQDGHLIILCAYQEALAMQIRAFLIAQFQQEIDMYMRFDTSI